MAQDNQAKNEATRAIKEFEFFVEEEEKRINKIAKEENERVMKVLREKEEEIPCPICLEDIPVITPREKASVTMICCGTRLCKDCGEDWYIRQVDDEETIPSCFACRRPVSFDSLKELAANGGRNGKAFALSLLADAYLNGKMGMERNVRKALECLEEAAALGDATAQSSLAEVHFDGFLRDVKATKSMKKATKLVELAVRQGHPQAYSFLGSLIYNQYGVNDRSFHCYSVASYQGNLLAMEKLGHLYQEKWLDLLGQKESLDEGLTSMSIETRKMLILATYWFGKAFENRKIPAKKDAELCKRFVGILDTAMKTLWHKSLSLVGPDAHGKLDPLTGYSHLPFVRWLINSVAKNHQDSELQELLSNVRGAWKSTCAQCGKTEENNKIKLKTCSRCRTFAYCSKECQTKHWKAGHKVDCKGHWVERFFPKIRSPDRDLSYRLILSFP